MMLSDEDQHEVCIIATMLRHFHWRMAAGSPVNSGELAEAVLMLENLLSYPVSQGRGRLYRIALQQASNPTQNSNGNQPETDDDDDEGTIH